jgi:hypothetical protein
LNRRILEQLCAQNDLIIENQRDGIYRVPEASSLKKLVAAYRSLSDDIDPNLFYACVRKPDGGVYNFGSIRNAVYGANAPAPAAVPQGYMAWRQGFPS